MGGRGMSNNSSSRMSGRNTYDRGYSYSEMPTRFTETRQRRPQTKQNLMTLGRGGTFSRRD